MKKQLINFLEAKDPEGKEWEVVLIQAGESENNRYYPAETLKKAVKDGLFEDAKCFAFEFASSVFNHLPETIRRIVPQGFVKNLVGAYDNIRYGIFTDGDNKKQEGILATLHIFDSAKWLRKTLKEAWTLGKKRLLELSIDAQGITNLKKLGQKIWNWVESIKGVNSVDIVTRGAAGGQFVRLMASSNEEGEMDWKELLEVIRQHDSTLVEGIDVENILDSQALSLLEELVKIEETPEQLQERLGFYTSLIDKIISLVDKKENADALKLLKQVKSKLEKFGYAYPVQKTASKYAYPYDKKYGYPAGQGKQGYLYKKPAKKSVKEGLQMELKEWQELMEKLLKEATISDEAKEGIRKVFKEEVKEEKDLVEAIAVKVKEQQTAAEKAEEEKKKKEEEERKKKEEEERKKLQATAMDRINVLEENLKKEKCKAILEVKLSESKLPLVVKEKIKSQFADRIFEEKELDGAMKLEVDTYSKLRESGEVTGLGQSGIEVTADAADKLQAAVDRMIDPEADVPEKFKDISGLTSLKECYRIFHPEDPTISGIINAKSMHQRLTENITTGDFTYALSVSMTKRAAKEFKIVEFPYEPIVAEVPVDSFKQQEIIKWGGFSTLPTVAQRGAYADLGEPSDSRAVYTPGKKGGLVYVTRETIKNDDLRYVQKIPVKIGRAGRKTRNRDVINLLLANGTYGPTGQAVFAAASGNYTTDSLNYDNLSLRKTAMKAQRENGAYQLSGTATSATTTTLEDTSESANIVDDAYNDYYLRIVYGTGAGQTRLISDTSTASSQITVSVAWTTTPSTDSVYEVSKAKNDDEKIGLKAEYIVFGDALQAMVDALLNSEKRPDNAEGEVNRHYKSLKPINAPQIEGSTYQYYWYLAAGKTQSETIEIGYVDGQKTPTLLLQDQPGLGRVFTNDEITWKVRFEYGLALVENKAFDGNLATKV